MYYTSDVRIYCMYPLLLIFITQIRENKIVELTRKFKFDRYSFSRLADNEIFEYRRYYLAAFVEGQFRQINGLTRTACEIWLKNEGLPTRESLAELY